MNRSPTEFMLRHEPLIYIPQEKLIAAPLALFLTVSNNNFRLCFVVRYELSEKKLRLWFFSFSLYYFLWRCSFRKLLTFFNNFAKKQIPGWFFLSVYRWRANYSSSANISVAVSHHFNYLINFRHCNFSQTTLIEAQFNTSTNALKKRR